MYEIQHVRRDLQAGHYYQTINYKLENDGKKLWEDLQEPSHGRFSVAQKIWLYSVHFFGCSMESGFMEAKLGAEKPVIEAL